MSDKDIKSFRETQGWSQQDLADRLGIDQATVSRIERGAEPSGPVKRLLDIIISDPGPARQETAA